MKSWRLLCYFKVTFFHSDFIQIKIILLIRFDFSLFDFKMRR